MKKLLTILAAVMLCVCCFAMVGCGVEGEYSFYGIQIGDEVYKEGDTYLGQEISGKNYASFELAKDGVCKTDGKVEEGTTWAEKDGKVVISVEGLGEVMEYEIDGNKLIAEMGNLKIIYKK